LNYNLTSLGWKAFQDLCGTILGEVLGQTYETFAPGQDGGRDGAFRGFWKTLDGEDLSGAFAAQCKFTGKDIPLSRSLLKDDLSKAARLAQRGLADTYILMTNHVVTGKTAAAIEQSFRDAGVKQVRVFGNERITRFIIESPKLRRLVPRVYGLGDLTQIIDGRAYAQAEQLLFSIRDDLSKFVPTGAYRQAARALAKHRFVFLLGEPACGKSTIASTLALSALDEWKLLPIKIDGPKQFAEHWNPQEPQQFFWIDDMFGDTQYQQDLADRWNKAFVRLNSAIRSGVCVVATSRDYIYRRALCDVKESSFPLLRESQVIINVQHLTQDEKRDILGAHVRRGEQPRSFRKSVKPYLETAVKSNHFLPEIARRLGSPIFTKGLKKLDASSLTAFFERPEEFLVDVIKGLGANETAVLALLFMHGGRVASPVNIEDADRDAIDRLGATSAGVYQALPALEDSLLRQVDSADGRFWTFRHPTIADAVGTLTAGNVELLDIYLRGTPTTKLLREVTCGAGVAGAKVKVPISRYDLIADRVNALRESWDGRRAAYNFLSERCGKAFLKLYLDRYSLDWKEIVQVNAGLSGSAEVRLVGRLIEFGLLPDAWRKQFVEAVAGNAVEIPSADFLTVEAICHLFSPDERQYILTSVREGALPYLWDSVQGWKSECDEEESPEIHFEDLVSTLEEFQRVFSGDDQAQHWLSSALADIDEAVDDLERDRAERYRDQDFDRDPDSIRPSAGRGVEVRSVFDDVDE
jgi:energy-coupling factor transporter ATP-binding protein EcfA2